MTDTYILNFISFPGNLVLDIFRAPIQIVLGLGYGIIFGLLLWILPLKNVVSNLFTSFVFVTK